MKYWISLTLTLSYLSLHAQLITNVEIVTEVDSSVLENTTALQSFNSKMQQLISGEIQKVKIFHFGDSHIQPNNLTGETRRYLQMYFGNAGRGLVFPYSLANTNGPKDYTITSNIKWSNSWCINYPHKFNLGIAGMGVQSMSTTGEIQIQLAIDTTSFTRSKAIVIYSMDEPTLGNISLNESVIKTGTDKEYDTIAIELNDQTQELNISFSGSKLTIHGIYFENTQNGIIYNSAGVAGARYKDFNKSELFLTQMSLLNPDLVIISLGTNESYDLNYNDAGFEAEVDTMISCIRKNLPDTDILLTLPCENYRITNGKPIENKVVENVSQILRSQADKHNCAIWDLRAAMGGDGSMLEWYAQGLVNKDHVHFLKAGYKQQGYLLFDDILNSIMDE